MRSQLAAPPLQPSGCPAAPAFATGVLSVARPSRRLPAHLQRRTPRTTSDWSVVLCLNVRKVAFCICRKTRLPPNRQLCEDLGPRAPCWYGPRGRRRSRRTKTGLKQYNLGRLVSVWPGGLEPRGRAALLQQVEAPRATPLRPRVRHHSSRSSSSHGVRTAAARLRTPARMPATPAARSWRRTMHGAGAAAYVTTLPVTAAPCCCWSTGEPLACPPAPLCVPS